MAGKSRLWHACESQKKSSRRSLGEDAPGDPGGSGRTTCAARDLGYLVLQRYRLYAEEGLTGTEVAVWIQEDSLSVEYGKETLSRYEVECDPASGSSSVGRLQRVKGHTLFETSFVVPQLRLFDLGEVLGEEGWVKFLKLEEYQRRTLAVISPAAQRGLRVYLFRRTNRLVRPIAAVPFGSSIRRFPGPPGEFGSAEPLEQLVDTLAWAYDDDHDHQLVVAHLVNDPVLAPDATDVYAPVE